MQRVDHYRIGLERFRPVPRVGCGSVLSIEVFIRIPTG